MPAQKVEYVDRPFVREPYRDSGYGRTLADLMLQRGNQAAALHLQRGDDQARMWQQAGGAVMGAVQDWTQRTQMEQERQRQAQIDAENSKIRGLQVQQSEGVLQDQQAARTRRERAEKADDRFASYFVPGDDGTPQFDMAKIAKDFEAEGLSGELPRFLPVLEGIQNTAKAFRAQQQDAIAGVFAPMLNDKDVNPESVRMLTAYLRQTGMAPAGDLDFIDQAVDADPANARKIVTAIVATGPEVGKKWREPEEFTIGPGQKRFRGESEIASVPPEQKPPAVASFEDFVIRKYGENPSPEQIVDARKLYQQADDRPITVNTGGQPRPLTQTAEAQIINRLSTQWTAANKIAKDLDQSIDVMDAGLASARRGDMAAGSQAVLVAFQKMLDPGSVVREGEFARSAAGQSLGNRIAGAVEKLTTGGSGVTLSELEKFAELAREVHKAQTNNLGGVRKRLSRTGARYSIPDELIFDDDPGASAEGGADGWEVIDGIRVRVKP